MTIVVGYVPKPEGRAALQRAVDEARLRGQSLVIVNASRGDAYLDTGYAPVQDVEIVKSQLNSSGVDYQVRQLVGGHEPADEVLNVAKEVDADLIVIGLRRRTPVGKLILGSTAQRILLGATCSVLAVKTSGPAA